MQPRAPTLFKQQHRFTHQDTQLLDMRPAAMLNVRLPFAIGKQQPNRDSGEKGRALL
jgi:hypothetical protein